MFSFFLYWDRYKHYTMIMVSFNSINLHNLSLYFIFRLLLPLEHDSGKFISITESDYFFSPHLDRYKHHKMTLWVHFNNWKQFIYLFLFRSLYKFEDDSGEFISIIKKQFMHFLRLKSLSIYRNDHGEFISITESNSFVFLYLDRYEHYKMILVSFNWII